MPAKYLPALGEERRPELHRQIGCVTGILQAFDRRHPVAAHKRLLPPGHALSSNPSVGGDCTRYPPQIVHGKNSSRTWADSQRAPSVELSQTSYSSSPSSSLSSLDRNRSPQQDLSSTDRMLLPERPFKSSPKLKSSFDSDNRLDYPDDALSKPKNMPTAQSSLPTLGIRNLVKDSIYKDSRDLSVRICTEEVKDHPFNCGDPPRHLDGLSHDSTQGENKGLMDINESLRVLAKLREASWTPSESGHHARLSYDAARLLYDDGQEASSKLREGTRLSLDVKEGHLWNREMGLRLKPSFSAADKSSSMINGVNAALETLQEQPACKRLPGVVAKLMGLEDLPEHNGSTASLQACKAVQESKQEPILSPLSISSHNEPAPQQQRNQDSTVRNIPNSKFPVETAPWKQQERIVLPRKLPKGSKGAHGREQPAASVYSDIEKRLKDLDFQQSNKDLRALKQILDSMQAKGLLRNKKWEEASMLKLYDGNHDSKEMTNANMRLNSKANPMRLPEERNTESSFKSPIVIMKPSKSANLLGEVDSSVIPLGGSSDLPQLQTGNSTDKKKASMINRTAKEQHAKSSPRVRTPQSLASYDRRSNGRNEDSSSKQKSSSLLVTESSSRRQQLPRDNSMQKHKNSISPVLLQKKIDAEQRARPPVPSAEFNENQRQSADRNHLDSGSPRSKIRRKPVHAQGDDGMHSGLNSRTRSMNQQGNDMPTRSDGSMGVASELDIEVTSTDRSAEVNISNFQQGIGTPSGRTPQKVKTSYDASKDVSSVDPSAAISERPSPVSVLDSSFDQEDLFPSRKTSNSLSVDDERHTSEELWTSYTKPTKLAMQSKNSRLANVASLLEKLQQLNVNKDDDAPPVDHIAFLCETESPDHRYVSEILLASGLLMKDLGSGQTGLQLHSSGYPINPDLFLVLEQRKAGWVTEPEGIHQSRSGAKSDPKRTHRKLIFDNVNELLLQKFEKETSVYSVRSFTRVKDPPAKALSGQELVKFLSSGIEDLETEQSLICQDSSVIPDAEILQSLQGWTNFSRELPGMVVEIERSIFKELVNEVVHGESTVGPQIKVAGKCRRRLFA